MLIVLISHSVCFQLLEATTLGRCHGDIQSVKLGEEETAVQACLHNP